MENENKQMQNQQDVNPTSQLDKIVIEGEETVETNGTGANRAVPTAHSVIIKKDNQEEA